MYGCGPMRKQKHAARDKNILNQTYLIKCAAKREVLQKTPETAQLKDTG